MSPILGTTHVGIGGSNPSTIQVPDSSGQFSGQIVVLPDGGVFLPFSDGHWIHWVGTEPGSRFHNGTSGSDTQITLDWVDALRPGDSPESFRFEVLFLQDGAPLPIVIDPTVENDPPPNASA